MSANSNALIIPGKGTVFRSAPNAVLPPNPLSAFTLTGSAPVGFSNLGHTSKQNLISFNKEGGEATTIDTFLADAVEVVYSSMKWGLNIGALQIDHDNLDLAFNGDYDTGGYLIPGSPTPVGAGLFLLFQGRVSKLGFWIPNTTVTLGDAPSVDTENFFELPLSASILGAANNVLPAVEGTPAIMKLFKDGLNAPAAAWAATTAYGLGDRVIVDAGELEATVAGTSGSTKPNLPGSVDGTVIDGTVTWTRRS